MVPRGELALVDEQVVDFFRRRRVAREVMVLLADYWPEAVTLTPSLLARFGERPADREFIEAVQWLGDEGLVAFEALIVGGLPETSFLGACSTRRGLLLARILPDLTT